MNSRGIKRLHDHLGKNSEADDFLVEILEDTSISQDYVDRLQYLLAISNVLNESLDSSGNPLYAHIGGYSVLAHLVGRFGNGIHRFWRTSHDLDMVFFDPRLLNIVKGQFKVEHERTSHLPNKKSYILTDTEVNSELELDAYIPDRNTGRIFINSREISGLRNVLATPLFYGIPVSIPDEPAILDLKLDIGYDEDRRKSRNPRPRDIQDIFDLLSVMSQSRSVEDSVNTLGSRLSPTNIERLCRVLRGNSLDITAKPEAIGKSQSEHVYNATTRLVNAFLARYDRSGYI